jgi:two-component system, OmpR family, response regulator MprA
VLTRDQILNAIWSNADVDSNALEVYIRRLWDKLESGGESRLIRTIRGAGYALRDE